VTRQPGRAPGDCDPIAIPAVGAVLDLAPGQWRFDLPARAEPAARTYTIDAEDLAPGVVVRVGKGAIDRFTHSIFLRITKVVDVMPDGRVVLRGNRVTPVGRPVEHLTVCVPADMLFPEIMT
jgi:hypothetical protein